MLRQEHALSTIPSTITSAVDSLDGAGVDDQGILHFLCVHRLIAEFIIIVIL